MTTSNTQKNFRVGKVMVGHQYSRGMVKVRLITVESTE